MIEWILTSCVLIVIVLLLRLLLKGKISLRLQYGLWLLVLIRLLIPVNFLSSPISVMNAVPEPVPATQPQQTAAVTPPPSELPEPSLPQITPVPSVSEPVETVTIPSVTPTATVTVPQQSVAVTPEIVSKTAPKAEPVKPEAVLRAIWVTGMAVFGFVLVFANLRFWVRLKHSRERISADSPLPVYKTKLIDTPCLFGLFRPAIYLTPDELEQAQLHHILTHEHTHYRHWDHIWSVLRSLCLILHWYNPLVWVGVILSRRDAELACDEGAIRRLGEDNRIDYGKTLLRMTCAKRDTKALFLTATTMTGSKKTITQRIKLIAKRPKTAVYAAICLILVTAIAVGCTFTGAKNAATTPKEDKQSTLPTPEEDKQSTLPTSEELPFNTNELEFWFSSGAGAWGSRLILSKDGSFTGSYHNTEPAEVGKDHPNGTRYQSAFDGRFEIVKQLNDYSIELQLMQVQTEQPVDTISFEDGMRIVSANAFGIDGGSQFILYLPNTTIEQIPEEERMWLPLHTHDMKNDEALGFFYLYNVDGEAGFYGLFDNHAESVIVTDKPAAEVLTTSYKLEDLRALIGNRVGVGGYLFLEDPTDFITLDMLQQNFPIECFKSRYIVYAVAEGGYFYIFPEMDKAAYEVGQTVVLADVQVDRAFYIPKVCSLSDYENIEVGKSTFHDVKGTDPNTAIFDLTASSNGIISYSILSDGKAIAIQYDPQLDSSDPDVYKTAIVANINIIEAAELPTDMQEMYRWYDIVQEDWPKETGVANIPDNSEITLAVFLAQNGLVTNDPYLQFSVTMDGKYYEFSSHNRVFMYDWTVLINSSFKPQEETDFNKSLDYIRIDVFSAYESSGTVYVNTADQLLVGKDSYYKVSGLYDKMKDRLSFHTEKSDQYFESEQTTAGNTYKVYGFDTSKMINRTPYHIHLTDDNYVYAWSQYGTGTMARRAVFYDPASGRVSPTYLGPTDYYQNMVVAYGENSKGAMDFCTVTVYDIFSGKALFTVEEYEIPINRTMWNAVNMVYFNVDGSAILVQYYDDNYDLHWQTIPLPTEVRLNRTVTTYKTTDQLPKYKSWNRTEKPWEDPTVEPSSNIPVPDQQAAIEIAQTIINAHFPGYVTSSIGFHSGQKIWVIGFSNADHTAGLMIAISWDNAQILSIWETEASATYTDGTTPWETEENLLSSPVISQQEHAGLIAEAIRAAWSRQAGMNYPHGCVQAVYHEKTEGYWIACIYPHAQYPVDHETYIAMDETDGQILKIWHKMY